VIVSAAAAIEAGGAAKVLAVAADRTSNGPHIVYPDPAAPGGTCQSENWVLDNFQDDPHARLAMLDTAENIARRFGFSRAAQDAATLLRFRQYTDALADDRAFQRRYMHSVHVQTGKHVVELSEDEGIVETTAAGLARLQPLRKDGTVTYGAQTHPADGNAGIILQSAEGRDDEAGVRIRLIAYGEGRAETGYMGMAPVPAAYAALAQAGLSIIDIKAIKTHNPFVVNDLYFASEMGVALEAMNNFGSSLIYGHPQAPTGMRLVIELIEELVLAGGGYGLFTGCAAGDTGAALVVRVD
jgi:acetyl-CoA acetyltransferase